MASSSTPLRAQADDIPRGLATIPRLPNGDEDTDELRRMLKAGLESRPLTDIEADEMWAELIGDE